ncbi:MAG: DUF3105 domain-containing protein [bacterium]|nr:DUF3105 domain-containing protein [bacterium]
MSKKIIWLLVIGLLGASGWWVWAQVSKPLPGEVVKDLGRNHVPDGTVVEYNSNPPTSGNHYADPTRVGVYTNPVSDGHLIHSLEHGYVILSYNCLEKVSQVSRVPRVSQAFAHEEELAAPASATASARQEEATESAALTGVWESQECKDLVAKLTSVYEKKGKKKLIVISRPSLDAKIALTAWGRIEKLSGFDEARIIKFIDAFRDKGPEKTTE